MWIVSVRLFDECSEKEGSVGDEEGVGRGENGADGFETIDDRALLTRLYREEGVRLK